MLTFIYSPIVYDVIRWRDQTSRIYTFCAKIWGKGSSRLPCEKRANITKGKTTYELKDKDCPPNSLVKLCFSSDFFIEEADEWRDGCWDFIRRRKDCIFVTTTKRPERIKDSVPSDWGDGWEHIYISISIENQEMADIRLKHFLEAPVKHREVFCSPLIGPISLGKYLDTGLIKCVNVGGEMAPKADVRPIEYEWVKNLYLEAKERNMMSISPKRQA